MVGFTRPDLTNYRLFRLLCRCSCLNVLALRLSSPQSLLWVGQHGGTERDVIIHAAAAAERPPTGSPQWDRYLPGFQGQWLPSPDNRPLSTNTGLPSPFHTRHCRHSGRLCACSRERRDRQQQLSLPKLWRRGASQSFRTALECLNHHSEEPI